MKILGRIPLIGRFFRKVDPSQDDVREFWKAMLEKWDTKRIDKASSGDMKAVAELLDLLKILNKQDFLRNFTTTIGNRIYTPFEPGIPTQAWPLWSQITVCVHEHHHVFQDRAAGGLGFEWNYITSPAKRAHYEAEAYRTNMVLNWRYQGWMPDPHVLAELILHYGCGQRDVEVMERMLRLSIPAIKAGAMTSDVCRWAVDWLDRRWRFGSDV